MTSARQPVRSTRAQRPARPPRLTARQASRAIYLDFEGMPRQLPTVLGHACEGSWSVTIVEPQLDAAAGWQVPGGTLTAASSDEVLRSIRLRAQRENRKVCAWTEHDLGLIRRIYADQPEQLKWWEANLINTRRQGTSFVRRHRLPVSPITNRRTGRPSIGHQAVIMESLCIDVPADYGRGVAANGIRALRTAIAEHGSVDAIDAETKRKWMATLLHNRYDCFGMAAIMCATTRGLGHTLDPAKWLMDPHEAVAPRPQRSMAELDRRPAARAVHAARIKAGSTRP